MRLTDEQIGAELRALRPTPSERFAADLDERAASGFRTEGQADWGLLTRLRRRLAAVPARRLAPAAGAAATLIVVAGVAISQTALDRGDQQAPRSLEAEPQGAPPAPSGAAERGREAQPLDEPASPTSPVAPGLTVPPTPPDGELKPGRDRVEERSASLTLSADPDEVAEIADRVVEVTERYDGFVLSSEVSSGDQDEARASFDLRIPTANLRAALADLSDLGHVSSRNEGSLDITAPFVTAEERFGDARAEVDALLEQLGEAGSADEIAAIRDRLRLAREELAAAREQLGALKQRRDYSVLSVSITAAGDGPGWSLGEAADDALSVLESIGGALLVALAVIVPLGALLALIWLGARRLTERRRDRALDRS